MGRVNLTHDESWRTAQFVVNYFETRLDDDEVVEAFHAVREILSVAMQRLLEQYERELHRLAKKGPSP